MGKYNFDEIIDRHNTNSLKWDYAKRRNKPIDALPLWVADMDFKCPKEVTDALVKKANHAIFGYSEPLDSYFEALDNWFSKHYGWSPSHNKFILVPGVVFGICGVINALTKEGDSIIINQPVYYPFSESIRDNKRKLVVSNLVRDNDKYKQRKEAFNRLFVKMFSGTYIVIACILMFSVVEVIVFEKTPICKSFRSDRMR